ncbi:transglycosylase [Azospirillum sp. TSO22-1]|nr:transglycosylase [Azospirillum sp. TSO22-1]
MAPPPAPPPPHARALPPEAVCIDAILTAEREAGLADNALLAMGFTEAGRMTADRLFTVWPWTVNAEGQSQYFETRDAAVAHVQALLTRGVRSIDVGCLQVNLKWHPGAFPDLTTAFEPRANAAYAARFLAELGRAHGSFEEAIGHYHSAQAERRSAYRQRVAGNRRWVAHAIDYLRTLAAGPQAAAPARETSARETPVWGKADLGRLSFLSSLYASGPSRPLLPDAAHER